VHQRTGCPSLLYFDPDILVLGSLGELYERLQRADLVMTPHVAAPIEDDRTPGERDFLLSGIYNLGFLGVAFNDRTLAFLGSSGTGFLQGDASWRTLKKRSGRCTCGCSNTSGGSRTRISWRSTSC